MNVTDDQILDGISKALEARDMRAAAGLIRLLAVQAPDKAQRIYDVVVKRELTIRVPLDNPPDAASADV